MTPSPLQAQFDRISKEVHESEDAKRFMPLLDGVREAMKELADAGFRVALEVRPAGYGFGHPADPQPYANGTMTIDGVALDFSLSSHASYKQYAILQTYFGTAPFRSEWFTVSDADGKMKDTVISMLLEAKARNDMAAEFNMGPGISHVAPAKPSPAKLNT